MAAAAAMIAPICDARKRETPSSPPAVSELMAEARARYWEFDETTGDFTDDGDHSESSLADREEFRTRFRATKAWGKAKKARTTPTPPLPASPITASSELLPEFRQTAVVVSSNTHATPPLSPMGNVEDDDDDGEEEHVAPDAHTAAREREQARAREEDARLEANAGVVFMDPVDDQRYTVDSVKKALDRAMRRWCPEPGTRYDMSAVELAFKHFNVEWDGRAIPRKFNYSQIRNAFLKHFQAFGALQYRCIQTQLWGDPSVQRRCCRVSESLHYHYRMLIDMYRASECHNEHHVGGSDTDILRFQPFDEEKMNPLNRFIYFLQTRAYTLGYARMRNNDEDFFKRVYNADGVFVHCYEKAVKIKAFVYGSVDMTAFFEMWQTLTGTGSAAEAAYNYLRHCLTPEIPVLDPDRYLISFRNGIYYLKEDKFRRWGDEELSASTIACSFIPRPFEEYAGMTDVDFDSVDGPSREGTAYDIPSPAFEKIMRDQHWPYQVKLWNYALFGRAFYFTGDCDKWQVWPFHHGVANVGKSTQCKFYTSFFNDGDTEVLSDKVEEKFGLWALHDKFGIIAPEVSRGFSISRSDLQSMITGENVSVKAKGQKAFKVFWRVPGIMAGNEIPGWNDAMGAMARRLVVFRYRHEVKTCSTLEERLELERPQVLIKCNRIYHAALKYVGSNGIWNHLPDYFRQSRNTLQAEISPVHAFLKSDVLTMVRNADGTPNMDVYVPLSVLSKKFSEWREQQGLPRTARWTPMNYEKALHDLRLVGPKRVRKPYPRDLPTSETTQNRYVFGIDTTEECERLGNVVPDDEQVLE